MRVAVSSLQSSQPISLTKYLTWPIFFVQEHGGRKKKSILLYTSEGIDSHLSP